MGTLIGFVKLIRPVNCLMVGFAVLVGASLTWTEVEFYDLVLKLTFGFLTAFTFTGASMAINDYYDREIDKINEPGHPIPSGLVTPTESLVFAAALTIIGLGAAALTGLSCLLLAVLAWTVMVFYNTKGKRTGFLGNMMVSLCVAIPFIYGSVLTAGDVKLTSLIFAGLAFLANTGREVTKGIVDVPGDRAKNVKTVAVIYGERTAAYVAATLYLVAVALSCLPVLLSQVSLWFVPPVVVADIGFVVSSIMLIREPSRLNARRIKNMVLAWMMMGLIAFIVGGLNL